MSDTKIEWATKSWNPVTGCTPISEGCANCYAARMAKRLAGRYGYPEDDPFKPGTFHPDKLDEPYGWKRPQKIFVCSMGDLFHDDVPFFKIARVWNVMFDCGAVEGIGPQHTFMILTKRPDRLSQFCGWMNKQHNRKTDYRNIWLGVTAENQRTADERIPILLQIPAAKRFVSVEPMLEPINLAHIKTGVPPGEYINSLTGARYWHDHHTTTLNKLDWVIAGPETGPKARPCQTEWIASLYRQCRTADVPFFDKKDMMMLSKQEWPR